MRQSEVPLSKVGGGVAVLLQDLGKGDFTLQEMGLLGIVRNPTVDPGSKVMPAGENGGSRGRTNGRSGIELREAHPLLGEPIEGRSLHGPTVATDVFPTKIVSEQEDDIGHPRGTGQGRNREENDHKTTVPGRIHGTGEQIQSLSVRNRELISASSPPISGMGHFSLEGLPKAAQSWLSTNGPTPEDQAKL
jgi:hypothetical protein